MPATAHATPLALVSVTPGLAVLGTINVAAEAPLFTEHFPQFPVLPGSLGIALGLELLFERFRLTGERMAPDLTLHRIAFLAPVRPGDQLTVLLHTQRRRDNEMLARVEWLREAECVIDGVLGWPLSTPAPAATPDTSHAAHAA
ncbi:hypothetical protein [Paraburkholderia hayleyella]|uniref:hypothetical protein n=1 Tax=Paraburkholderia hayleyella TaxID=2152889 RepID=UPI0015802FB7|nr:hypothetical protein [Paraburkholderia hayleyella]